MVTNWRITYDFVESVLGPAGWVWDQMASYPIIWVKNRLHLYQRNLTDSEIALRIFVFDGSKYQDLICELDLADPDSYNKLQQFVELLDENSL